MIAVGLRKCIHATENWNSQFHEAPWAIFGGPTRNRCPDDTFLLSGMVWNKNQNPTAHTTHCSKFHFVKVRPPPRPPIIPYLTSFAKSLCQALELAFVRIWLQYISPCISDSHFVWWTPRVAPGQPWKHRSNKIELFWSHLQFDPKGPGQAKM